jgi:acetolactate decarboxylase
MLTLLLTVACNRREVASPTVVVPDVRTWGTLREVMHEGRVGAKVALSDAITEHTFAVGALAGLTGEITAVDGNAYVARAERDRAVVAVSREPVGATLLVASIVPAWKDVVLHAAPTNSALDDAVESAARAAGVDVEKPFPFLVEGSVDAAWHVLRHQPGEPAGGGHEAHLRNALTGKIAGGRATLVGFFSRHHQGVFTHMGQRTHIHVITDDRATMGHVDEVAVRPGAVLKLPAR